MKVAELIAELQHLDPEAEVHFSYNYGDYWRTTVAPEVSEVFEGYVKDSSYHQMPKLMADEEDCYTEDGDINPEVKRVIVLG